jgi:hypothetical protein
MRRRKIVWHDPVRDYDGLCQYGKSRITPDEMTERAKEQMRIMEDSIVARRQDEEANRTPVGGMQFR